MTPHPDLLPANITYDVTTPKSNETHKILPKDSYDAAGALWFVVSVILVYGFSVICVFFFNSYKKRQTDHDELDRQAMVYVKNISRMRDSIQKQELVKSAALFMKRIPSDKSICLKNGINTLNYLSLPVFIGSMDDEVNQNHISTDEHSNFIPDKYQGYTSHVNLNLDHTDAALNSCQSCNEQTVNEYTINDILEELSDDENCSNSKLKT